MKLFAVLALMAFQAQQGGQFFYTSPDGTFVLENFDRGEFVPSGPHAEVTGTVFHVRWLDRGLVLSGKTATIDAGRDSSNKLFLAKADVKDQATLVQDTKSAYDFIAKSALEEKRAVPPAGPDQSHTTLTSDQLQYRGDESTGTVTLPAPFVLTRQVHAESKRKVKKTDEPYVTDDSIEVRGASGVISFVSTVKDINGLKTGSVAGPVTMHMTRKSTTGGVPDPDTNLDGVADRVTLDFTGAEHTITLEGNVSVTGKSDVYAGYTKAAKAVLVFGADGKLQRIDMTGSPTETNIKPIRQSGTGGKI